MGHAPTMLRLLRTTRWPVRSRHAIVPGTLALAVALLAPVQAATPGPGDAERRVRSDAPPVTLAAVGDGMREAAVPLPSRAGVHALRTGTVSMVAATWSGDRHPTVEVSTRRGAGWTRWRELPHLEDGPSQDSGESSRRRGTDLVWIKRAEELRVRTSGTVPSDLELVVVDTTGTAAALASRAPEPRASAQTASTASTASAQARRKKPDSAPQPRFRPRVRWGAKEKWRDGDPVHMRRIRQIHIHHTVNANDYSRADVPGMIRGMYRYHTKSLGWSDIGYNVLVDRFGRAWVGRFDGPRRRVRGAHTLGFNHNSTGVAVIGNYETQRPHRAVVRVLSRISAWQLDRHGRKAVGTVRMESHGSDRYKKGRKVRLPVIDGHRHTNQTACPGKHLMAALPTIRANAQRRIERY